jgi:hypothetical protein
MAKDALETAGVNGRLCHLDLCLGLSQSLINLPDVDLGQNLFPAGYQPSHCG